MVRKSCYKLDKIEYTNKRSSPIFGQDNLNAKNLDWCLWRQTLILMLHNITNRTIKYPLGRWDKEIPIPLVMDLFTHN